VIPNELSIELQQSIVSGANLGSLHRKFRIGAAGTSDKVPRY
jgi:hypothetical protein